jgi:hypothetical protein
MRTSASVSAVSIIRQADLSRLGGSRQTEAKWHSEVGWKPQDVIFAGFENKLRMAGSQENRGKTEQWSWLEIARCDQSRLWVQVDEWQALRQIEAKWNSEAGWTLMIFKLVIAYSHFKAQAQNPYKRRWMICSMHGTWMFWRNHIWASLVPNQPRYESHQACILGDETQTWFQDEGWKAVKTTPHRN